MSDELSPKTRAWLDVVRNDEGDALSPNAEQRERMAARVTAAVGGLGVLGALGGAGKAAAAAAAGAGAGTHANGIATTATAASATGAGAAGASAAGVASTGAGTAVGAGAASGAATAGASAAAAGAGVVGGKLAMALLASAVAVAGGVVVLDGGGPASTPEAVRTASATHGGVAARQAPAEQPTGLEPTVSTSVSTSEGAGALEAQGTTGVRATGDATPGTSSATPTGIPDSAAVAATAPTRARPTAARSAVTETARTAKVPAVGPSAEAQAKGGLVVDDPHARSIQAELTLVGAAQYHLRRGEAEEALALLDRHRGRFPKGALRQERSAARAMALCALGRHGDAAGELAALAAAAPGSPLLARVRNACGSE